MPEFPTSEIQILTLGKRMLRGFFAHGAVFPSINKIKFLLTSQGYWSARESSLQAKAQAKMATITKQDSLSQLRQIMKNCLRKAEVDVAGNPEKLALIGWGPKAPPSPADPPSQPRNLHLIAEGQGMLWLAWDRPATGSGGPIRNYIVERREQPAGGGESGMWAIVSTALNNEIALTDQLRGVQLEYRVKAVNTGGDSVPSNTVPVVL